MKQLASLFLLTMVIAISCRKKSDTVATDVPVTISIQHAAGAAPLQLGTQVTIASGDPVTINVFKYYLSNFSVVYDNNEEQQIPDSYFLVDEANASSKSFSIPVKAGNVKTLRFWIGVDSTRNVSGVQTGALDPANGMFWTWNSGYIFAKLEGRSFVSTAPLQAVTYHIGGFRTGQNALRQVSIPFSTSLPITTGSRFNIILQADALKWFTGAANISIGTESTTMEPGALALKIANNYANMFSLREVQY